MQVLSASANGQIYTDIEIEDKKKWTYRMQPVLTTKHMQLTHVPFKDAVLDYKILDTFRDSPVSARWQMKDIICYKLVIKNKMGNEGKTSWDSSKLYTTNGTQCLDAIITAVQEAQKAYDTGLNPKMLVEEKFDRVAFKDVVNAVFAQAVEMKQMPWIEEYPRFWMSNHWHTWCNRKENCECSTQFSNLFEEA